MPARGAVSVRTTSSIDARALTMGGWAAGLACTVTILGTPHLLFGYYSPQLHLVLNSVDACVALLLAYLLFGRFGRSQRLQDLLLAEGLLLLAVAGLGSALLVDLVEDTTSRSYSIWLPLALRFTAAVLVLAAALVADRRVLRGSTSRGVTGPAAVVLTTVVLLWVFREALPVAASESPPVSAHEPVITGHPLLLTAQVLAAACFLVASLTFTVQARRRPDEVLRWLGPGCALAGFARVNYALFPSLYSGWLYTGDMLRTVSYLCLLVGATREISRYWAAQSQVAVLEDRRRLARELHDGVVQELGWIKSEARALSGATPVSQLDSSVATSPGAARNTPAEGSPACDLHQIVDACDRALDEARAAVDALGRDANEPLGYALHRAAREVADRYDGHVVVQLDDAIDAEPDQRHDLARITREAVGNALRHGAAECVRITLEEAAPGRRRLKVHDDGRGFDVVAASQGSGFGLTSMRERAHGLPGTFDVQSSPGQGTTVEVTW